MFEYELPKTVFTAGSRHILVLKTGLMSYLNAENPFQFTGHGGDEVEVIDDQIVFLHRQTANVFPQLNRVNLAQHFFVV